MPLLDDYVQPERAMHFFFGGSDEEAWAEVKAIINTGFTLADVEGVDIVAGAVNTVNSVAPSSGNVALAAADIPFTPTGTIAATTVQGAIAEAASESGAGGSADLDDLGASMLAVAIWDPAEGASGEYVWSGGVEPVEGFTNVLTIGPNDPVTADGVVNGRDVDNDIWIDNGVS